MGAMPNKYTAELFLRQNTRHFFWPCIKVNSMFTFTLAPHLEALVPASIRLKAHYEDQQLPEDEDIFFV